MSNWAKPLTKAYQLRGRGNKYGAKTVKLNENELAYRSGLESEVHAVLKLLERAGEIRNIRREQTISLTPSISHRIDFVVFNVKKNTDVGVEAKGQETEGWSLKQRLYVDFGPLPIEVWKKSRGRVGVAKEIKVGKYRWLEKV